MIDIIAHRGNTKVAPDNSISAIKECLKLGVKNIEIDVTLSKDKIPVIFHEDYIDNLTLGKGLLKDYTFDELKSLSLNYKSKFGNKYKNERIISLTELLEYIKNIDVHIILDFHPNDDVFPIINVLKNYFHNNDYVNKMTLMVRNFKDGAVLKQSFPAYKIYLTCPRKSDDKHAKSLSAILIYVCGPAMVISAFQSVEYSKNNLTMMGIFFLVSLIVQALIMIIIFLALILAALYLDSFLNNGLLNGKTLKGTSIVLCVISFFYSLHIVRNFNSKE